MTNSKRTILSNEEKIGIEINVDNDEGVPIYFTKLVEVLKGEISRTTISKVIDKLFDLGMMTAKWENVDGKWIRSFRITGEYRDYFKNLNENIQDTTP